MRIRPATPADLPVVSRLAAGLVRLHHRFDPERFMLPEHVAEGYARFLAGELDDKAALVLVADASDDPAAPQVIGYAYGRIEGRNWALLLDRHGELIDLYVDEQARGRGAATALVEAMVRALEDRGAPRVVLNTATSNIAAQRLFARLGFRATMVEMTRERG